MSVEILAPAGNAKCFISAINAGANAIYIGLSEFSARKNAENFCVENLSFYLNYAHFFGVKVYVAVNTLVKDSEIDLFLEIIEKGYSLGVDAFIMQDMFLGREIKKQIPEICLHLSTQAGVCNALGAKLAKEYGFDRVILARETAVEDISEISKIIETEVFVQGALCTAFSGHCYMSSFAGGLSGNRGYCKQPCRKKYTYKGEGFEPFKGYNLSLSDLCLKDKVSVLSDLGVASFKIEGRMRSPEYVYTAVSLYKESLIGEAEGQTFKYLKRAFNRGDYTEGYFSGITTDIISSKIQGNKGDFVGLIKSVKDNFATIKTDEKFCLGDGFKIIRNGEEIGNGIFNRQEKDCVTLAVKGNIRLGDKVFITKDQALADRVDGIRKNNKIFINIEFYENEKACAEISDGTKKITILSDQSFPVAKNSSLSEEGVIACFNKTDDYPFEPELNVKINGNVFVAKSMLNAFRRKCYVEFFDLFTVKKENVKICLSEVFNLHLKADNKSAYIVSKLTNGFEIKDSVVIYKPDDYSNLLEAEEFLLNSQANFNYLYIPPYATGKDISLIKRFAENFDGLFCEGYFGIALSNDINKKLFCGTGFNVFNKIDVKSLLSIGADFVYSKELNTEEIYVLSNVGYTLTVGNLQVMDLIYCPFSMQCSSCKRGNIYTLTDEDNRDYTVRRYKLERCRFEVYNPYDLLAKAPKTRVLCDFSLYTGEKAQRIISSHDIEEQKKLIPNYTKGHLYRGIK